MASFNTANVVGASDKLNGALDALVTSLIIVGAISMGIKTVMGRNAKPAIKNLKKEATPSNIKKSDESPAPKRRGRPRNSIEVISNNFFIF